MDSFARGLKCAAKLIEEGVMNKNVEVQAYSRPKMYEDFIK